MKQTSSAADYLPVRLSLPSLRNAAGQCQGCELNQRATQTVFGEGTKSAEIMIVGEMPGDREDLEGKPFVGPAGKLLDEMLVTAGIRREKVYMTNAVKHFRWEERGKRRLHKKPTGRHIEACKPWLWTEIKVIQPKLIVCLGATAAQVLLGREFRITKSRGRFVASEIAPWLMATYHPSAILRAPTSEDRAEMKKALLTDLRRAAKKIAI